MKREKLEIIYSVAIIIAIPIILVANTIYLVRTVRAAYNSELRQKADVINSVAATMINMNITELDVNQLDKSLNNLEKAESDVVQAHIVVQKNGEPVIIARSASAPSEMNDSLKIQTRIVYERKQSVARLISVSKDKTIQQAWSVATPILNSDGQVVAVLTSSVLTTDAQKLINSAFAKSFVFLVVSIIIIVFLLFRHFRLVGYIQLLAKQRELNQTMTDFLSVATHELKAPTSIMKGYIANVIDGTAGPINDEAKDQLSVALSQVDRLNNLVQDLLNVSRVEQGRVEYKIESVDTTAIISTIIRTYRPIAEAKGLQLIFEPNLEIPAAKSDSGRVQEIFTNLIDNAIKYTPSGSVTVSQIYDTHTVTTTISDTGLGMNKEDQKRLFQRFYRVKTEKTKEINGTGLGLWIIKQYIEAMGGSISLNSAEGKGSDFTVTLPINK